MTAVFTTLLLSGATSAYAGILAPQCGSLWNINSGTVFENPNEVSVLVTMDNCNDLTQDDLFGYGALTDGTHVVGASHGGVNGFLDSEWQKGDPTNPIPHNHLINLEEATDTPADNDCFDLGQQKGNDAFLVTSLSFESPGVTMFGGTKNTGIEDDEIKIWEVTKVIDGTDALTMKPEVFTLGNLGLTPPVVSFHLDVTDDGVCVTVADVVTASLEDLAPKIGGEFLPIDTTALLLAGAQTNLVWIMSALAVIGTVAFGVLYITAKKN